MTTFRPRVLSSLAGALVAACLLGQGTAHAQSDPLKCKRAIAKEGSKFIKAELMALQRCEEKLVKDKLGPDPGRGGDRLAFCKADSKTAGKITKAVSKLGAKIGKACGGPNRVCGDGDDNLDMQGDVGFPAACPNFESGTCTNPVADCAGVVTCIQCIHEAAVDQAMELYYEDLFDYPDPRGADKVINKCQQAIGKATAEFFLAKEKVIAKCWDARFKGKHDDDCPDATAPAGGTSQKAAAKIAKAESKKIAKICKLCGGPGKACRTTIGAVAGDGLFDDLGPFDIGLIQCPFVVIPPPPGPGATPVPCGGGFFFAIEDLIRCVDCVTEFKVDCAALAQVPQFRAYPSECNLTPTPTPTTTPTPTVTATPHAGITITEIIDSTGDGTNGLGNASGIAVNSSTGNVYVAGQSSDNAFEIAPGGTITEIIDSTGDGTNGLGQAFSIAVNSSTGNAYVAGSSTDNAFEITPGGTITEIIDSTGDGTNGLDRPTGIAVNSSTGNVYVGRFDNFGTHTDRVFEITPGGTITAIIDSTGDGTNDLRGAIGIAVNSSTGNVYVVGFYTDNVFEITPGGTITEIIDSTGDGTNGLELPRGIAVNNSTGNVYVSGQTTDNAFEITPGGTITEIIDSTGDGTNGLDRGSGIAVDSSTGNVYVTGNGTDNAFEITPGGTITEIINAAGDGTNGLDDPFGIAVDSSTGNVYVVGIGTRNAFEIEP